MAGLWWHFKGCCEPTREGGVPTLEICAPERAATGMTHDEIVYWQQHHAELVLCGVA